MRVLLPLCWSKSLINSSLFASGCCLATSIADCMNGTPGYYFLVTIWKSCDRHVIYLSIGASQMWLSSKFQQHFCHIFPIEENHILINRVHSSVTAWVLGWKSDMLLETFRLLGRLKMYLLTWKISQLQPEDWFLPKIRNCIWFSH